MLTKVPLSQFHQRLFFNKTKRTHQKKQQQSIELQQTLQQLGFKLKKKKKLDAIFSRNLNMLASAVRNPGSKKKKKKNGRTKRG
jgi:hypothetical protein